MGKSSWRCSPRPEQASKPVQNFISTVKALGIDQFYQRHRIVVQKKSGPTGDPYFSFDFQYVEARSKAWKKAKVLRNLYDSYAKWAS